ncbi:Aminodeoxychorismate synthase component 1 [invertebrate metagenome]|uniref:aminodeoxychorismate synthase n=1 Tax=invertebrate metagenome TaxID=1711999 RepID=A0A2H9T4M0_9ZZZZ
MENFYRRELPYHENPVDYFERIRNRHFACLLDSCHDQSTTEENNDRFDIMTSDPVLTVTVTSEGKTCIHDQNTEISRIENRDANVFETLSRLSSDIIITPYDDLPFSCGFLGFWGYELGEFLEKGQVPHRNVDSPLMCAGLFLWSLVIDHKEQKTWVVMHPSMDKKLGNLLFSRLTTELFERSQSRFFLNRPFKKTQPPESYNHAFAKIQRYIEAGDCYEVNLTQEFTAGYTGDCWKIYKHLRIKSPAPYAAFLSTPSMEILSLSPEQFVRMNNERQVETRPIKGTIPRGNTPEQDRAYANILMNSKKDQAENVMIVDLLRNDLGQVCEPGSIKVPELFALKSYSNVHHLVSTITGTLSSSHSNFDLMRRCFPGGSITGAPKIRAMQIIRELEPVARNAYCGSIGYFNNNQAMDTNIAIRSIVAYNKTLHCWGGGAITSGSQCENEYKESVTKISNLIDALHNSKYLPLDGIKKATLA